MYSWSSSGPGTRRTVRDNAVRPARPIGTVPRVGVVDRVRARPWLVVAIAAGILLVAAWLAWAIHVASEKGFNEALGVLIAWPALLIAAALILCPPVAI